MREPVVERHVSVIGVYPVTSAYRIYVFSYSSGVGGIDKGNT